MRTPSKPLFKIYEIVAIVAFLLASIAVGSLKLVFGPGIASGGT